MFIVILKESYEPFGVVIDMHSACDSGEREAIQSLCIHGHFVAFAALDGAIRGSTDRAGMQNIDVADLLFASLAYDLTRLIAYRASSGPKRFGCNIDA